MKNQQSKIRNPKPNSGFTLVEALVSVGIVALIMSSILFNYSIFNDNLALTSAAQELAVTFRQAQTYGLTVREVAAGGGNFTSAYGVHIDKNDPTNYYLFADLNADQKYDVGGGCGSGPTNTDCVSKFTFRNGVKVSEICDGSSCPPNPNAEVIDVTFLRPNPDAVINFINGSGSIVLGPSLTGKIILTSPKGRTLTLTVESTGQVLVGQPQ